MGVDAEMFVRRRGTPLTEREVRRLARDLVSCFGRDALFVWLDGGEYAHHALSIIDVYEQDGPDIVPEPGEQFIRVHLNTRYYGPGYERGHLPDILAIADWLKRRIPDCSIWYGGDSSGICAEELTTERAEALWSMFCKVGHDPYAFGGIGDWAPNCEDCGGARMKPSGGGPGMTVWYCPGCEMLAAQAGMEGSKWLRLPTTLTGPVVYHRPEPATRGEAFAGWDQLREMLAAPPVQETPNG